MIIESTHSDAEQLKLSSTAGRKAKLCSPPSNLTVLFTQEERKHFYKEICMPMLRAVLVTTF